MSGEDRIGSYIYACKRYVKSGQLKRALKYYHKVENFYYKRRFKGGFEEFIKLRNSSFSKDEAALIDQYELMLLAANDII